MTLEKRAKRRLLRAPIIVIALSLACAVLAPSCATAPRSPQDRAIAAEKAWRIYNAQGVAATHYNECLDAHRASTSVEFRDRQLRKARQILEQLDPYAEKGVDRSLADAIERWRLASLELIDRAERMDFKGGDPVVKRRNRASDDIYRKMKRIADQSEGLKPLSVKQH